MEQQEPKILETFVNYGKAFMTLQPEMVAPFFHEPAIFISNQGVIVMNNESEKLGVLSHIMNALKTQEYDRADVKNIVIKQLSNDLAVVNADNFRYNTSGEELERFSIAYTFRYIENSWKLIVAIIHDLDTPPPYYVPAKA